jgi:hypothetical protein
VAFINLRTPGSTDGTISRDVGMSPPNTYDFGIISSDAPMTALLAAPRNIAAQGSISYGIVVTSLVPEGGVLQIPNNISTYVLGAGAQVSATTIAMPISPWQGQTLTLACAINGVTSLTMQPAPTQTLFGGLTSIAAGQWGKWQMLVLGSAHYWIRIG